MKNRFRINKIYIFILLLMILVLTLPYGSLVKFGRSPQFKFDETKAVQIQPFNDGDGDLLNKTMETTYTFTDFNDPDSDDDGICDGAEYTYWEDRFSEDEFVIHQALRDAHPQMDDDQLRTHIRSVGDIDGDGYTNILDWDSDGDKIPDGWELENNYDPAVPADITDPLGSNEKLEFLGIDPIEMIDSDSDGLPDLWEETLDCRVPYADDDNDGKTNLEEYLEKTHPKTPGEELVFFEPFQGSHKDHKTYLDFYLESIRNGISLEDNYDYYQILDNYFFEDAYEFPSAIWEFNMWQYEGTTPFTQGTYNIEGIDYPVKRDLEDSHPFYDEEDYGVIVYKRQTIPIDFLTVSSSSKHFLESTQDLGQVYYKERMELVQQKEENVLFRVHPPETQRYWTIETADEGFFYESTQNLGSGWSLGATDQRTMDKLGSSQGSAPVEEYEIFIDGAAMGPIPLTSDTVAISTQYYTGSLNISIDLSNYDTFSTVQNFIWNYTLHARNQKVDLKDLRDDSFKGPASTDINGFVPFEINKKIEDKAVDITKGQKTDLDKCLQIQKFVLSGGKDLFELDVLDENWTSLDHSTAFFLLAKAAGIPARITMGYGPGIIEDGRRTIRQKDEHAWAEVNFKEAGWVGFEVTPINDLGDCPFTWGADDRIISYDKDDDTFIVGGQGYVIMDLETSERTDIILNSDKYDTDGDRILNQDDEDADGDTISNEDEITFGTDPLKYDTDGDGLGDGDELLIHKTNPYNGDSNGNGQGDGDEAFGRKYVQATVLNSDPVFGITITSKGAEYKVRPWEPDRDRDWLMDDLEEAYGLNTSLADSDGDFVPDGVEFYLYHSRADDIDSDHDEAMDYFEVLFDSDPLSKDSDQDGLSDKQEIHAHVFRLPKTAASRTDTDGNLIPDGRERYSMLLGVDPDPPNDPDDIEDPVIDPPDPDIPSPGITGGVCNVPMAMIVPLGIILLIGIVIAIILIRQKPPEDEILEIIERTRKQLSKTTDSDRVREIIIECYKAMLQVFEKNGMPRMSSETATEFKKYMFTLLPIKKAPMHDLTVMFEVARYSDHVLKAKTRKEAIRALTGVREEILRVKRTGEMRSYKKKRARMIRNWGEVSEAELTKRRNKTQGNVVFHQDMTQEAEQAYFLKELQSYEERYFDHASEEAKEKLKKEKRENDTYKPLKGSAVDEGRLLEGVK